MHHILGLVGSPRPGGNTELLVSRLLESAAKEGAETKLFTVAGKSLAPCQACGACVRDRSGRCVQRDAMEELYPLARWADAIVFGTPVYLNSMSAQLKIVLDRFRPLWWQDNALSGKVAAVVTVGAGRWGGQELAAEHVLSCAFNHGMVYAASTPVSGGTWRLCAVGRDPGDVLHDADALAEADALGRRLAQLHMQA